jgi:hypothetical protein
VVAHGRGCGANIDSSNKLGSDIEQARGEAKEIGLEKEGDMHLFLPGVE